MATSSQIHRVFYAKLFHIWNKCGGDRWYLDIVLTVQTLQKTRQSAQQIVKWGILKTIKDHQINYRWQQGQFNMRAEISFIPAALDNESGLPWSSLGLGGSEMKSGWRCPRGRSLRICKAEMKLWIICNAEQFGCCQPFSLVKLREVERSRISAASTDFIPLAYLNSFTHFLVFRLNKRDERTMVMYWNTQIFFFRIKIKLIIKWHLTEFEWNWMKYLFLRIWE